MCREKRDIPIAFKPCAKDAGSEPACSSTGSAELTYCGRGHNTRVFRYEYHSTCRSKPRPRAAPALPNRAPGTTPAAPCAWRGCPATPAPPCTAQGRWVCLCALQSSKPHQPQVPMISAPENKPTELKTPRRAQHSQQPPRWRCANTVGDGGCFDAPSSITALCSCGHLCCHPPAALPVARYPDLGPPPPQRFPSSGS